MVLILIKVYFDSYECLICLEIFLLQMLFEFFQKFLCMSTNIDDISRSNVLLYHIPVLAVHLECFQKPLMLFMHPSAHMHPFFVHFDWLLIAKFFLLFIMFTKILSDIFYPLVILNLYFRLVILTITLD